MAGVSAKDMEKLSDIAKEMGIKTKFSAKEASDALYYLASAGWKTQEMLGGLEGVMNLAAASGEDLASTSNYVVGSMKALGLQANESARFADVLAKAASNSNTNVAQMGEAFKAGAGTAGMLKYKLEDVSLAMGLMANSNIKGSQAGRLFSTGLLRMVSPTDDVALAMKKLNINMTDAKGQMIPLNKLIDNIRTSFSKLTPAQQASNASIIFGKNAIKAWQAIINAAPEDVEKLTKAIADSGGAAQKMADIQLSTLSGRITLIKSSLEGLGIKLYETFNNNDVIKKMANVVLSLVNKLAALPNSVLAIISVFAGLAAAVGPILLVFGGLISLAGGVITGISAIAGIFATIGPVILPLIAAIPLLIAQFVAMASIFAAVGASIVYVLNKTGALNQIWDILKTTFNTAKEVIQDVAKNAFEKLKLAISTIKSVLDDISKVMKPFINETLTQAKPIIQDIVKGFGEFANVLINGVGEGIKKFKEIWDKVFPVLEPVLKVIFENIKNNVIAALETIKNVISIVTSIIKGDWSKAWEGIKSIFFATLDNLVANSGNIFNLIKSIVVKVFTEIKTAIENKLSEWKTAIVTKFDEIKTSISAKLDEWWTAIVNWFTELPSKVSDKLNEWKTNIVNKFVEIKEDIVTSLGEWWTAINDWFASAPGKIKTKLQEWKTAIIEWTKAQNEENKRQYGEWWNAIKDWFTSIPGKLRERLEEWKTTISTKFTDIKESIKTKITEWWEAISTWFTELPAKISAKFEEWKTVVGNKFTEIKESIKTKVEEWWTAISEWFTSLPEKMRTGFTGAWESIKTSFDTAKESIKTKLSEWWESIKSFFTNFAESLEIKESGKKTIKKITDGLHEQKPDMMEKLGKIVVDVALGALVVAGVTLLAVGREVIKRMIEGIDNAKPALLGTMSNIWNDIKNTVSSIANSIYTTVSGKFNAVKTAISDAINGAKNTVSSVMGTIKSLLSDFKFPKIKLPHFTIKGKFDLATLSVPSLGVDWYAKGGIFNSPRIIGIGEAGSEAVVPLEKLDYIMANAINRVKNTSSSNSFIGGGDTYNINGNITIDASSIKEVADIINIFKNLKSEKVARGGAY
jgi:TP901 family phage tail tape measure protein